MDTEKIQRKLEQLENQFPEIIVEEKHGKRYIKIALICAYAPCENVIKLTPHELLKRGKKVYCGHKCYGKDKRVSPRQKLERKRKYRKKYRKRYRESLRIKGVKKGKLVTCHSPNCNKKFRLEPWQHPDMAWCPTCREGETYKIYGFISEWVDRGRCTITNTRPTFESESAYERTIKKD